MKRARERRAGGLGERGRQLAVTSVMETSSVLGEAAEREGLRRDGAASEGRVGVGWAAGIGEGERALGAG